MNRRIAKKIVQESDRNYSWDQRVEAARLLGLPAPKEYFMGIDQAHGYDYTAVSILDMKTGRTETGRFSTETLNTAVTPKSLGEVMLENQFMSSEMPKAFNYRTGAAPSHLPGALRGIPQEQVVLDSKNFVATDYSGAEIQTARGFPALKPLADQSLTELKDTAKAMGRKGYSTLKKAELIELIEKG